MMRNKKGQFVKGVTPWHKGRVGVYSQEILKKFSEGHLKNPTRYWLGKKRPEMVGEKNPAWKGDDVSYHGLHQWINKYLGKPTKCEFCGKDGLTGKQIHWASKSRKPKRDLTDWIRLCANCHLDYDGTGIKKGQHLSPETEFKNFT